MTSCCFDRANDLSSFGVAMNTIRYLCLRLTGRAIFSFAQKPHALPYRRMALKFFAIALDRPSSGLFLEEIRLSGRTSPFLALFVASCAAHSRGPPYSHTHQDAPSEAWVWPVAPAERRPRRGMGAPQVRSKAADLQSRQDPHRLGSGTKSLGTRSFYHGRGTGDARASSLSPSRPLVNHTPHLQATRARPCLALLDGACK